MDEDCGNPANKYPLFHYEWDSNHFIELTIDRSDRNEPEHWFQAVDKTVTPSTGEDKAKKKDDITCNVWTFVSLSFGKKPFTGGK